MNEARGGYPWLAADGSSIARARAWLAASTWAPAAFPRALRGALPSCIFAVAIVSAADGVTAVLEHMLPGFAFHGMAAFLALSCVAVVWGSVPATAGAACNAILLSYAFVPPRLSGAVLPHLVSLVLSFALGSLLVVLVGTAEARRRRLLREGAERLRLLEDAHRARVEADSDRSRLQQVIEALPEAVVLYDGEGRQAGGNRSAKALLGANALGQLAGQGPNAPRHLDGSPYTHEELPILRSLRQGEVVAAEQLLVRNLSNGTEHPLLLNSAPLRGDDGSIHGVVAVFQDITSIKNVERERERLWAMLSHDLKNPLTSIYGMAQLLQHDVQHLEASQRTKAAGKVSTILSATERVLKEINSLVEQSRTHLSCLPAHVAQQSVDLVALLRQLVSEYQQATAAHHIQLRASGEAFLVPIEAESLHRVAGNVLANAIKYSPKGGIISLEIDRLDEPFGARARVRVTDQGMGIPSADLARVFEQFFRASNVEGVIAGSGVGLAGVRQVIERYGGTVSVESELRKGTTVTLDLPLIAVTAEKEGAAKLDPTAGAAEGVPHPC